MSARDAILAQASAARSASTGDEVGRQRDRRRPARRRAARASSRRAASCRRRSASRSSSTMAEKVAATRRARRRRRRRAGGGRRLSARAQSAGAAPHGRRSAARRRCRGSGRCSRSARRRPTATIAVGLSHALAGVAETGTLVLASGADNPTTLNFLPDTHIVVLDGRRHRRRLRGGLGQAPRALRQGRDAAHGQPDHRPVALGRHRADASSSARTGRAGCTSSSSAEARRPRPALRASAAAPGRAPAATGRWSSPDRGRRRRCRSRRSRKVEAE